MAFDPRLLSLPRVHDGPGSIAEDYQRLADSLPGTGMERPVGAALGLPEPAPLCCPEIKELRFRSASPSSFPPRPSTSLFASPSDGDGKMMMVRLAVVSLPF